MLQMLALEAAVVATAIPAYIQGFIIVKTHMYDHSCALWFGQNMQGRGLLLHCLHLAEHRSIDPDVRGLLKGWGAEGR